MDGLPAEMMLTKRDVGVVTLAYKSPDVVKVMPSVAVVIPVEGASAAALRPRGQPMDPWEEAENVTPDLNTAELLESATRGLNNW